MRPRRLLLLLAVVLIALPGQAQQLCPCVPISHEWIVLRRIVTGSATTPADAPFKVESFPTLSEATSRFAGIEDGLKPMLLTAPDGNVVIVMRSSARRRAAGH